MVVCLFKNRLNYSGVINATDSGLRFLHIDLFFEEVTSFYVYIYIYI
jgi:hypothetical protein